MADIKKFPEIKNLSLITSIKIEGTDKELKVDFSDKRFINKLLKLVKKYQTIGDVIDERVTEIEKIEDELDKLIAFSDMENEVLGDFKNDVNETFNADVTGLLFGDCLPDIERYFPLFESIIPYAQAAKAQENKMIADITDKYGIGRIQGNLAQAHGVGSNEQNS